ncbi:hypothetical protein [Streptomyces mirabilis]|uniref:hypothetical protein n=1 Tax=Streptomyces mirabilis TaxID=68239 RepID=UPI00369CF864
MSDEPELFIRGPGLKKQHRIPRAASSVGRAPCPWPDCRCLHEPPCVAGWIDTDEEEPELGANGRPRTRPDGTVITHTVTKPCPNCRPEASRSLADPMLTRPQQIAKIRKRKDR